MKPKTDYFSPKRRLQQTLGNLRHQRWQLFDQNPTTDASLDAELIVLDEQIRTIREKLASFEQDQLFNTLLNNNPNPTFKDTGYFYCPYCPVVKPFQW